MTSPTATFDTVLGRCGVRWSAAGISAVLLPSPSLAGQPDPGEVDVPDAIRSAIWRMTAVLAGVVDDLQDLPVDLDGVDELVRAVYAETRRIPPGQTRTYGDVARALGLDAVDGPRAVGAALARNRTPIVVPCHRVLAATGALHGFSAPGGLETKRRMLELEGAPGFGQQVLFE